MMNEFDRIDDQNQNTDLPSKNDSAENVVRGVVYSPDRENNGYTVDRYQMGGSTGINGAVYSTAKKRKRSRVSTKSARSMFPAGAFILVMCLLISFASGFISAYFASEFIFAQPAETKAQNDFVKPKPEDDRSYIDTSKPPREESSATIGQLMTMEDAIEAVRDSVVEITTETVNSGMGGYSQYVVSGAGSGVIVSTGGYIITNNHVIEGASNIIVRLTDGSEYEAVLIGTDAKTDVAVLLITPEEGKEFVPAVIGTASNLRLGQTVIAIGNPLGELGGTVTDGIISSLARDVVMEGSGSMTLLQTNAAVSPGNSGGGLFDLYGRLVGVVNAKTSGQGVEGISFAIPVDTAWDIATQLITNGYVSGRPSLGIPLKQVQYGAGIFGNVYAQVIVAADVEKYGLKANDIIISVNGYEIIELDDIAYSISANNVGDDVVVRIKRDRKYYELKIKLVEYLPDNSEQEELGV